MNPPHINLQIRNYFDLRILTLLLICLVSSLIITLIYFFLLYPPNSVKSGITNSDTAAIQNPDNSNVASDRIKETKVLFVGDIMLARSVGFYIQNGNDPFKYVKDKFAEYDVIVGNLETTIANPKLAYQASKQYTFNAPLESVNILKKAGFTALSLANNHTMDYGPNALIDQIKNLETESIATFGAGRNIEEAFKPSYLLVQDTRIAFIGVNDIENWITDAKEDAPGSAFFNETRIKTAIAEAKKSADLIVVVPHWGYEYFTEHNENQEKFGKLFIDAGADLVIGSHPHVIQDSQTYKGKMIYYSLGNFVFDLMQGIPNATTGLMVEFTLEDKKLINPKEIKIQIDWQGFPKIK